MSSGSTTRAVAPIDLDLVAGNETTPNAIDRQIEECGAAGLYALSGQAFACFRVENEGNHPGWHMKAAMLTPDTHQGLLGEGVIVSVLTVVIYETRDDILPIVGQGKAFAAFFILDTRIRREMTRLAGRQACLRNVVDERRRTAEAHTLATQLGNHGFRPRCRPGRSVTV